MTELGTRLKEARTARGYSLDDLQEMTKIQKRYLAGIEEGNYSMMPGPFYVRAFIKQYADAVGLDSDELLESYKQELPSSASVEMQNTMSSAPSRRRPISRSSSRMTEALPMVLVALFIIVGIIIFWFFYQNLAKNNDPAEPESNENTSVDSPEIIAPATEDDEAADEPAEDIVEEPVEQPEPAQKIEVGANDGTTTNYVLSGTDKFSVKMVARGRVWVGVRDQDGVEPLARELAAGETVTLDLSEVQTARIRIGAISQVDVFVNDEKVEYGIPNKETQNMLIQFSKPQ